MTFFFSEIILQPRLASNPESSRHLSAEVTGTCCCALHPQIILQKIFSVPAFRLSCNMRASMKCPTQSFISMLRKFQVTGHSSFRSGWILSLEKDFFLIKHLCKYSYLILLMIDIPIYPSKWVQKFAENDTGRGTRWWQDEAKGLYSPVANFKYNLLFLTYSLAPWQEELLHYHNMQ